MLLSISSAGCSDMKYIDYIILIMKGIQWKNQSSLSRLSSFVLLQPPFKWLQTMKYPIMFDIHESLRFQKDEINEQFRDQTNNSHEHSFHLFHAFLLLMYMSTNCVYLHHQCYNLQSLVTVAVITNTQ